MGSRYMVYISLQQSGIYSFHLWYICYTVKIKANNLAFTFFKINLLFIFYFSSENEFFCKKTFLFSHDRWKQDKLEGTR